MVGSGIETDIGNCADLGLAVCSPSGPALQVVKSDGYTLIRRSDSLGKCAVCHIVTLGLGSEYDVYVARHTFYIM